MHMRYALDTYQYIALGCAALVLFIIIQSLVTFVLETYKRRADARRAVERLWNLPRGEPLEPQPTVSAEVPLSIGAEVQQLLEREESELPEVQPTVSAEVPLSIGAEVQQVLGREEPELPEVQPTVSAEVPLSIGAEVQQFLEREEPELPGVQPTVSAEVPLSIGAEVRPILEHREPLEVGLVVSPKLPLPLGSKVWAVCNFGRVPQGAPGIITGAAEARFFWESPMYLCTFANDMKVRARPKDIEPYNHRHSLQELEQADFDSMLSQRMTLRAQHLLSRRRPTHLPLPVNREGQREMLLPIPERRPRKPPQRQSLARTRDKRRPDSLWR